MDKDDGDALWDAVTRDVKPLKGREKRISQDRPKPVTTSKKSDSKTDHPTPISKKPLKPQGHDVDRNTFKRFQKGEMNIDATLDLHGMNQGEACEALGRFILSSHAAGHRCVIVITGKGRGGKKAEHWSDAEPGILKRRVPEWLEEASIKTHILQVAFAQPKHGGDGALYVLLRRKRN